MPPPVMGRMMGNTQEPFRRKAPGDKGERIRDGYKMASDVICFIPSDLCWVCSFHLRKHALSLHAYFSF